MRKVLFLIGFLLTIGIAGQASAITIQNASFEYGLNDWDSSGTASTNSSFYYRMNDTTLNATDGDDFAQLTGQSSIYQELIWSTGDIISFDWNFLGYDGGSVADYWYFGISDSSGALEIIESWTLDQLLSSSSSFDWQSLSYEFESDSESGDSIIFGVYSTIDIDSGNAPVLLVDNITTSTVPEPATLFLLGFGLLSIAGISRKL